jgi:hypothetical protein
LLTLDDPLFFPLEEPLLGDVLRFFLPSKFLAAAITSALFLFAARRFSYDLFSFYFPDLIAPP